MTLNSCLYTGSVKHYRTRPKRHVLSYRVFLFLFDLAELDALASKLSVFSRNRFNVFSFHDADFGLPDIGLKEYVNQQLHEAGFADSPAQIKLLCSARILGYTFNPLSVFYCYNAKNELYATVYEVHNTRGERHTYVLDAKSTTESGWIKQSCEKAMYVSPFVPAVMSYRFALNQPDERISLTIKVDDESGTMVGAGLQGERGVITDRTLLRNFMLYPLLTLKVIVGIHYEALKLWVKGVEWFKYLPKSRLYAGNEGKQ